MWLCQLAFLSCKKMPELVDLEESFGVAQYLEPMGTIVLAFGELSQQECGRVKPFTRQARG